NVNPPATRTGVVCGDALVVPTPSCPATFAPQQYAAPDLTIAQLCVPPLTIAVAENPTPPTAVSRPVKLPDVAASTLSPAIEPIVQRARAMPPASVRVDSARSDPFPLSTSHATGAFGTGFSNLSVTTANTVSSSEPGSAMSIAVSIRILAGGSAGGTSGGAAVGPSLQATAMAISNAAAGHRPR